MEDYQETPLLDKYCDNLTANAQSALNEYRAIGRDQEIKNVIYSLLRKTKNAPVLVGEAGVGKTAVVEGLAAQFATNNVPERLIGQQILKLDLASMTSTSGGSFASKFSGLIKELKNTKDTNIIFIDEIHELVNTGAASSASALDAGNILKPALARGEINLIGATTIDEYHEYIEQDRALQRRFQVIELAEPSEKETIQILSGIKNNYEKFHHIQYTDDAIKAAVELSSRYIVDRFLPDKAIDLIDEAGAIHENSDNRLITQREIAEVLKDWTGIPVTTILKDEATRLGNLEQKIKLRVKGQDEAVRAVANAVTIARAGLQDPHKPISSFLFLGSTGVGKTELAKALTEAMFDREDNHIRMDMSEYSGRDAVAKLIGEGKRKGFLTEAVKHMPYSVVLFDELEKAQPEVWNLLLQILDDGRITSGDYSKRLVSFKNTIIIMTTNVGSEYIDDLTDYKGSDFQANKEQQFKIQVNNELVNVFRRPEFINRIDHTIVFNVLNKNVIQQIARTRLVELAFRLKKQGYNLVYEGENTKNSPVIDYLADMGTDVKNGARPLARLINRQITALIAKKMIQLGKSNPHNFHTFYVGVEGKSKAELSQSNIDERKLVFKVKL
ncbi:ATP-dependent Clp protease ATP-binding subunit [Pediococcus pentosaceus]|uniref:AAA family ATPase n=1 Tax=Pediococcus pentosaceus TaxID=1255 RepID=UPI001C1EE515|nr:ATP-dependent Clp protease ATP-binding subunit [Pediococcus pentosaceus]MBU7002093.1 ATP-dependent Clp protease ATP-binding subunit [Pediococcus pentosaceus]MCG9227415.1 ATP-dependent Clp protease ATP-binding subunit [Pediococcus pentosaceus]MDA8037448.1 ATP-dependent Clp protease ATP-binding subunit [Pediococcus pentosaceus]